MDFPLVPPRKCDTLQARLEELRSLTQKPASTTEEEPPPNFSPTKVFQYIILPKSEHTGLLSFLEPHGRASGQL